MDSICGADCKNCPNYSVCSGCAKTDGCPFGEKCMVATLVKNRKFKDFKKQLIQEFNNLEISDMKKIDNLFALKGSFVNLEFELPGNQVTKFWNDNKILLGNQVEKFNSDRCYGLAADEKYLMVCEYSKDGKNPELVIFKRRDNL